MKRLTWVWLAAVIVIVGNPAVVGAEEVEVIAKKVTQAPTIDGKPDKLWDSVKAIKVTASDGPQGDVEISIKTVYTDKDLYMLLQWPDKTMSLNRMYELSGTEWKKVKGNEDRFSLMWDIGTH
jgi:hypothetical protein